MAIQTKTMVVKSDTALAETKTTIRDTVTFDTSKLPNGITYKGLKAVLSFADPIQWDKASTYDSLTVVWDDATHASYASKRPVPQNIELTNEFYWFRTADLDAQVEMYRQEVQQFDSRITANAQAIAAETARAKAAESEIQKVNVALIGDSYTAVDKYYFTALKSIIPSNVHVDRFAVSATGFVRETSFGNGTNIPNRLGELINGTTVYDYVIMYAGINDYNNTATLPYSDSTQWGYITTSQEINAIKQTMNILRSSNAARTAQILFLPNSMKLSLIKQAPSELQTNDYIYWYYTVINKVNGYKGLKVVSNSLSWLMFVGSEYALDQGYREDNVHPNDDGGAIIASNIAALINGTFTETCWGVNKYSSRVNLSINEENVEVTSVNRDAYFDGHTLTLTCRFKSTHTFSSPFHLNIDFSQLGMLWFNGTYRTTYESLPYEDCFYATYLSLTNQNNTPIGVLVIPESRPNGSKFGAYFIVRAQLC